MSAYDFDAPVDRTGTWSSRWERHAGRDVIPLWVADTDFKAPPEVLRALAARLEHGVLGYTVPPPELTQALVERLQGLYGWKVAPEWLVPLPGVVPGLHHAARSLTRPDEHVLSPRPVYHHLTRAPELAPRAYSDVPLVLHDKRWVYDMDALRAAMTPRTRMLFFCNPQNPGGTVFTRAELLAIAEATRDALIVSDEIHCDLLLERGCAHVPIASLAPEIGRRTVTLLSPNKAFNFPGAGCAWAVIEDPVLRRAFCVDVQGHAIAGPTVFGYVAALAAYREGAAWLAAQLDYLRGNLALVEREIGALQALSLARTQATYLAWIDASRLGVKDPTQHFLDHGVALSPGSQFGAPAFVRLNFGTQRARLQEALRRIAAAVSAA
ncbi:MAG TPA: PatB family C-S lyase [Burkholderiales bacterium]|nr:PatB family C-S lyase [Burkholderiales bacterium]